MSQPEIADADAKRRSENGTRMTSAQVRSSDAVRSARSRSPAPIRNAMSGTTTAARMPPAATSNSTLGSALTLW